MPPIKHARVMSEEQEAALVRYLKTTRDAQRNLVIFLLSIKAGLHATQIAALNWSMVCDETGQIAEAMQIEAPARPKREMQIMPIHPELRQALSELWQIRPAPHDPEAPVIYSMRAPGLCAAAVRHWFDSLYAAVGMKGYTSFSGRRTFILRAVEKVSDVGGSLRDVQSLAGHASLITTQRYVEEALDVKWKLVKLL